MERINMRDVLFRITAALCLASVTDGAARVSLALGVSVTAAAFSAGAVMLPVAAFASRKAVRLSGAVTAVCTGVSFASIASAFLGLTSLSGGVFIAAAVWGALIIGVCSENEYNIFEALLGCVIFTLTLASAGAVREIFGAGSVFGFDIGLHEKFTVGVLNAPAGGMLVCAVMAALLQCILTSRKEMSDDE